MYYMHGQNTVFVITCIGTAVAFSLGDLSLFEPNSMGAKLFYAIWIIGLYFCIPGTYNRMSRVCTYTQHRQTCVVL